LEFYLNKKVTLVGLFCQHERNQVKLGIEIWIMNALQPHKWNDWLVVSSSCVL